MKYFIMGLFLLSSTSFAIKKVVKFKAGSELADSVKMVGSSPFKAGSELSESVKSVGGTDDTAEAKKKIMRDAGIMANPDGFKAGSELSESVKMYSPVKFKAGSELADSVKSIGGSDSARKRPGRTKYMAKMINNNEELHDEVCKEEIQALADLKKLADELVNLTVACTNELLELSEKGDIKAIQEVSKYCKDKSEEIYCKDDDCDGLEDGDKK